MSCYLRHLKDVMAAAGIKPAAGNRQRIDDASHQITGVTHGECPSTWRIIKQEWLASPEKKRELATRLKERLRE